MAMTNLSLCLMARPQYRVVISVKGKKMFPGREIGQREDVSGYFIVVLGGFWYIKAALILSNEEGQARDLV